MPSILIIDDEQDIREIIQYNLKKEGFEVQTAENGIVGLQLAEEMLPDLIMLDVMMPLMDGIEVCEKLRANPKLTNTLICFLTARNEDYSQIAGLEAGADDYIAKPVKPKVLVSKVHALLRRKINEPARLSHKEMLYIDREKYLLYANQQAIQLPRKEFELIALLIASPEKVFERNEILKKVWGNDIVVGDRTIDVHIRKLREKIGLDCIKTIKGVGYKFEMP